MKRVFVAAILIVVLSVAGYWFSNMYQFAKGVREDARKYPVNSQDTAPIIFALPEQEPSMYDAAFEESIRKEGLILTHDSAIIQIREGNQIVDSQVFVLPNYLEIQSPQSFKISNTEQLTVTRTNYTDVEFNFHYEGSTDSGTASLSPHFYLGAEMPMLNGGEFVVSYYYVKEASDSCLYTIGFGNQNIAAEHPDTLFAVIGTTKECKPAFSRLNYRRLMVVQ